MILSRWIGINEVADSLSAVPASSSAREQEEGDSPRVCVKETVTDRSALVKGQTISKI